MAMSENILKADDSLRMRHLQLTTHSVGTDTCLKFSNDKYDGKISAHTWSTWTQRYLAIRHKIPDTVENMAGEILGKLAKNLGD